MEHRWILAKVGGRIEQVSFPFLSAPFCYSCIFLQSVALSLCHTENVCKCLFFVVWQLFFYGFYICQGSSEHSVAYGDQLPKIAAISRRITLPDGVSTSSHAFVCWLTTHSVLRDITAFTGAIFTWMCTCFGFPACYTKFITQMRKA